MLLHLIIALTCNTVNDWVHSNDNYVKHELPMAHYFIVLSIYNHGMAQT